MDCGPTCLRMVAKYYGESFSLQYLRDKCYITREGVSLRGISEAAETIGFRTLAVKVPYEGGKEMPSLLTAPMPVIAHWNQNHFVVIYKATKDYVWLADPGATKIKMPRKEIEKFWCSDNGKGILLLLEPSVTFGKAQDDLDQPKGLGFLLGYLKPHRKLLSQLVVGLFFGSLLQLIFPFLTQAVVDVGIQNQNIGFIYLVLIGQVFLFFSQTIVNFIQAWIVLHISTRINVGLVADFLIKLMNLPLGFFDAKMTGDLLQRIQDHRRIEQFLTHSSLSVLLSFFSLVIFGIVLFTYNFTIFGIFLLSSILYIVWIMFFLKKRKEVDYMAFQQFSDNQNSLIEIIQGMPEIKLQGSEQKHRWKWTHVQAKLFKANIKSLAITQYQDAGGTFISQFKDIIITFIAAKAVIEGSMTLGMMLAIQYMIGQLNAPLQQLVGFIRSAQDAKISLERLGEIHNQKNEETDDSSNISELPPGDLKLKDLSFKYTPISPAVLKDINITIPRGKTTAIVGMSGSGKTTLIKLLLGFYEPTTGTIDIGHMGIQELRKKFWRRQCGVVMQDGYIFSDTIANNIAESDERVDYTKVSQAIDLANIKDFIDTLPMKMNTIIGARGNGVSQGQRQRLLIARAIYKNPDFIFMDEATNALDSKNEKVIVDNLKSFFGNKTVVVVAHRLSTVMHADQIIVLEEGKVVETGKHDELIEKGGIYFNLIKEQLALGN